MGFRRNITEALELPKEILLHLPLILTLYGLTGKLLWSSISVLTAYLC